HYLEWFSTQGFPKGKLGMLLATTFEIKTNGLQEIIDNLKSLVTSR
ncbi:putative quorum-sensing-regulated virulence factor, partial [Capnocytophaga leadbetteri]